MTQTIHTSSTETHRQRAIKTMTTDWPAFPDEDSLGGALNYNKFIAETTAIPQGPKYEDFPDPYGRPAQLDISYSLHPNVTTKKRAIQQNLQALWTVERSPKFHDAAGELFHHLDLNNSQNVPTAPAELMDLPPEHRRMVAIDEYIHSAAKYGDTDASIGVAWSYRIPEIHGRIAHQFRLLPRNIRWMGFCGHLPLVKDCYFLFCRSNNHPDQPGHITGYPSFPEHLDSHSHLSTSFESDEARTLNEVLRYHGANGCFWRPD